MEVPAKAIHKKTNQVDPLDREFNLWHLFGKAGWSRGGLRIDGVSG